MFDEVQCALTAYLLRGSTDQLISFLRKLSNNFKNKFKVIYLTATMPSYLSHALFQLNNYNPLPEIRAAHTSRAETRYEVQVENDEKKAERHLEKLVSEFKNDFYNTNDESRAIVYVPSREMAEGLCEKIEEWSGLR